MDIALVASCSEAFGRVTVEAMLAGMLVIGADVAGTSELICDGVNGILYEDDNQICNLNVKKLYTEQEFRVYVHR